MKKQRHIIREQILELEFSSRTAAERWQAEAAAMARRSILPLLDRYLDELCEPNTLIRIDTLELNIGTLDAKRLTFDLEEKLRRQLKPALTAAIRRQSGSREPAPKEQKAFSQLELLDTFITTGTLPWWADSHDQKVFGKNLTYLLRQKPEALKARIKNFVKREQHLMRLVHHFSDSELVELIRLFDSTPIQSVKNLISDLNRMAPEIPEWRHLSAKIIRQEIWKSQFYAVVLPTHSTITSADILRQVLLHLSEAFRSSFSGLISSVEQLKKKGFRFESRLPQYLEVLKSTISPDRSADVNSQKGKRAEIIADDATNEMTKEEGIRDRFNQNDELYIDNAGLVLLWPFLPRFFENMRLVKDKAFVDEFAPHKAIALLQFLADGSVEPPEYLLPLNKVLCGIPLETPFEAVVELEKEELEAAASFLEAVIANAPILKNMSIEGFRNTFLRRKGILSFEDGHWMLRVERETYDLVLDRFPWPFKIVKLPWMAYVLYVDW